MSEANRALAKRWLEEVWNEGRRETLANYTLRKLWRQSLSGPTSVRPLVQSLMRSRA